MTSRFELSVNYVLKQEGGLASDGLTNMGITQLFLRSLGKTALRGYGIYGDPALAETIASLQREQAIALYQGEFWAHAPFGEIVHPEICMYVFDMAVNMGIAPAVKCTQRACWAVLRRWAMLPDDGLLGVNTLTAVNQAGYLLQAPLRAVRGEFYRDLVQRHPEKAGALTGWLNRTYDATP